MDIKPINAIVYNQEKVDINDVIAPPYDVITSAQQDELYKKSPCIKNHPTTLFV